MIPASLRTRAGPRWLVRHWRSVAFLGAVSVVVARAPELLIQPRFWQEEGTLFFAAARVLPWWEAAVLPHAGYLALVISASTTLAAHMPLEWAPTVTTLIALVVQILPIVLVLAPSVETDVRVRLRLGLLGLVLVMPSTQGSWLTTLGSQFYLAGSTGLLLILPILRARWRWLARGTLVLAGLSSPQACLLAPLVAWEAIRTRARERMIHTMILAGASALQLATILLVPAIATPEATRFAPLTISLAGLIAAHRTFTGPLLGLLTTSMGATISLKFYHWTPDALLLAIAVLIAWLMTVAVLALGAVHFGNRRVGSLLLAYLIVLGGSLPVTLVPTRWSLFLPGIGGGYFYAPMLFLFSGLWLLAAQDQPPRQRVLLGIVILLFVMQSLVDYTLAPAPCPSWTTELANWRRGLQRGVGLCPEGIWWVWVP